MIDFIVQNWLTLSGIFGGVVVWFTEYRKRKNSDVDGVLKNLKLSREIENDLLRNSEENIKKLIGVNNSLRAIIAEQTQLLLSYELKCINCEIEK